jgi:hypothetical protein
MSALSGSEDLDDNFREVLRDRITLHTEHLSGDELLRVSGLCIELRANNGSLAV